MELNVPAYDRPFSLQTNNLPFPAHDSKLGNLWRKYKGYKQIPTQPDIELGEVGSSSVLSDTAPLLGSGIAATGGLIGGSTSVLGTGGSIATGVLGATAVGILGAGAKSLFDRTKEKGAVLPGSEYIGPFNPVPISAAKDAGEQAAKTHDVNYGNLIKFAQENYISQKDFTERVHEFDQQAIDEFESDWQSTGNWRSFVGKHGLKLKQLAEQLRGQSIYPSRKYIT